MTDGNTNNDTEALLALLHVPGVGNGTARTALRAAQHLQCDMSALITMDPRALLEALPPGDHQSLAQAIEHCTHQHYESARRLIARCTKTGVTIITVEDEHYPAAIYDRLGDRAPVLLSMIGNASLLENPGIAVVGAREVSDTGRDLARTCGKEIAKVGRVLISGGANGVDDSGQRGAANTGGGIVVVLPQGLLKFRGPPYIRDVLREQRALLISACLPDAPWKNHAAVERNDIIAALAEAVCVIEPKKTGGSIRTARTALEYGRHVLVQCTPDSEQGCTDLIRAGAEPMCVRGSLPEDWLTRLLASEQPGRPNQTSLPGMDET